MSKVLVSLVSEQTIPNVLFIKEKLSYDKYIFVTTLLMEASGRNRIEWILNATLVNFNNIQKIIVKEDSLEDIELQLTNNTNKNDEFVVNLTCGNKIMSIGVYNFFTKLNSQIEYIPIRTNQIHSLLQSEKTNINYRIGVEQFLVSYGIRSKHKSDFQNRLITNLFFQNYISGTIDFLVIERLRLEYRNKKKNYKVFSIENTADEILQIKNLSGFLNDLGFENKTDNESIISDKEIDFITGGWFEEYCFWLLKDRFNLAENEILLGVNLVKNEFVLDNDLDVVFTFNNNLYVLECKTAMSINGKISNQLFNETIYKASALRAKFGLTVQNYLLTLSNMINPNFDYFDRAKVMSINLFDRKTFETQDEIENFFKTIN